MRIPTSVPALATSFTTPSSPSYRPQFEKSRMAGTVPVWHGESSAPAHISALQAEAVPSKNPGHSVFKDILDTVNPLQQLPIVGGVYREMTGQTISPAARVIGGTLFGGPIGAVLAMASLAVENATGQEPVAYAMNGFHSAKQQKPEFDSLIDNLVV